MVTVVIMVGEKMGDSSGGAQKPNPQAWIQAARREAATDLVTLLVSHQLVEHLVTISPDPLNLPDDFQQAYASKLRFIRSEPGPVHVGQHLASMIEQYQVGKLFYFGGGSAPLLDKQTLSGLIKQLDGLGRGVITNNTHASDWAGITPASVLRDWVQRLPQDNMLGWVLSAEAGLPVYSQPTTAATRLDIDTPTDLLTLKLHSGTSRRLASFLNTIPLDTSRLSEALTVLRTPASQVFIAGRLSPSPWSALNQATQCWLRVVSEERGMVSSGRLKRGEVTSILADYIEHIGLNNFFQSLGRQVQAAFIDTRVLLAHHGSWPPDSDRFASDLGLVDQVEDRWLKEFTGAAFSADFPIILGGHGLLSGDLLAFCELL